MLFNLSRMFLFFPLIHYDWQRLDNFFVINKTDLAPRVGASLEVMAKDSERMRGGKDFLFTCKINIP